MPTAYCMWPPKERLISWGVDWGAKEPAVRDELKVFEVCVAADLNCDELAAVIVPPTAVVAETADQAKLLGVRLADAAERDMEGKPLDVSRLTVLVRPFV